VGHFDAARTPHEQLHTRVEEFGLFGVIDILAMIATDFLLDAERRLAILRRHAVRRGLPPPASAEHLLVLGNDIGPETHVGARSPSRIGISFCARCIITRMAMLP